MTNIFYQNQTITVGAGQTVLESLEQAGFSIPYSCRKGLCHSCMMQASSDDKIPPVAQQGLSVSQIAQGFLLACCCKPSTDLSVALKGSSELTQGTVLAKKVVNASVLVISIQVDFRWFPGQYLTVWKDDVQGRSYSIASRCDQHKIIELHIARHSHGVLSPWLHDDVPIGSHVTLSQPLGDCFYTDDHHAKPLVMACTGTGLAPLYGILQEALVAKHTGPIYFYAASGEPEGLYYTKELSELAEQHQNLHYIPTVRRNATRGMQQGDVLDVIKEAHPELNGHKVFICGAPKMVNSLQRQCFFQGAAMADILVDAFEMSIPNNN